VEEWEADNGPATVELTVLATTDYIELGQALQEMWEQAGIDVEINSIDAPQAGTTLSGGAFEAFTFIHFHGSDPDVNYPFWDPDPENIGGPGELSINFTRYTSPTMERVMHGARETGDQAERAELYGDLWEDFAENVPQMWLFHIDWLIVADKDIRGLESTTTPEGDTAVNHFWGYVSFAEVWRQS
jgi:peptide/nickel transport system substrate-binding protein